MAQFPYLPLWTDAWAADTDHLTCEEEGIYFRLVRVMWRTPGCRVPNDDQWLAKHLRMTLADVAAKARPIISEFCQTDGNFVFQKRLVREFTYTTKTNKAQSERAKARWRKEKENAAAYAALHQSGTAPTPTPTPTPKQARAEGGKTPQKGFSPLLREAPPSALESRENLSARALASAPYGGALTRSPDSEPAERKGLADKKSTEMTLADVNAYWQKNGGFGRS